MALTRAPSYAALALVVAAAACTPAPGGDPAPSDPAPSDPVMTPTQPPRSELPAPDTPTPVPGGAVTASALPRAADLAMGFPGRWAERETTATPSGPLSACQRSRWQSTGATGLQTRQYAGPEGATAAAVVLSFPDAMLAQQALATLTEWQQACPAALDPMSTGARLSVEPTRVEMVGATGQVSEVAWRPGGAPTREAQGLVQSGDRVAVLIVRSGGDANQVAAADHPLTRSLGPVAQRLRG